MVEISLQLLALLYMAIYVTAAPDFQHIHGNANVHRAAIRSIVALYITGVGYAFGWNAVQYVLNPECERWVPAP